jgi:plastocyanin
MSRTIQMTIVLLAFGASGSMAEEKWGNVTMRFVLDGEAKPPVPVKIKQDPKICGEEVFDESLLVNPKDRGIANVVVWLVTDKGEKLPVHPSYEETRDAEVVLQTKACRYEPRIALLQTAQRLRWKNPDPIGHVLRMSPPNNPWIDSIIPTGKEVEYTLTAREDMPVSVVCNIHPWMSAHILVRDNPYMAVSDKSGNLKLANVPAGKRTFYFWHERHWLLNDLTIGEAGKTRRGRLTLDVAEGENDLGEVRVPASMLERRR